MADYAQRLSLLRSTYEFHKNGMTIIETTTPGAEPRQVLDPLRPKLSDKLLLAFLRVEDAKDLLRYAERFDLPDRNERYSQTMMVPLTSKEPLVVWRSIDYYLQLAAMLRWLVLLLNAVKSADHALLASWITNKRRSIHKGNLFESSTEVMVILKVEPKPGSLGWEDWNLGSQLLYEGKSCHVTPQKWNKSNEKARLDCASAYLAEQINVLVSGISPALTPDGKQSYAVKEPVQAMALRLYDQYAGATRLVRCLNPNCPKKFFLPRPKDGRKPRSDRRFCDIPSCQSWYYDNVGRVRTAKRA